jgi:hypothetical protein
MRDIQIVTLLSAAFFGLHTDNSALGRCSLQYQQRDVPEAAFEAEARAINMVRKKWEGASQSEVNNYPGED